MSDLEKDFSKAKKLMPINKDFKRFSDCKHCVAVSCGVFGCHYRCVNKGSKYYGSDIVLGCAEMDCYEMENK